MYIAWDVEAYHKKRRRDPHRAQIRFPNPMLGAFSEPLTIVDVEGRIVLWYLPGLLSVQQQVGYSDFPYLFEI